jgi:hypothetical protein
MLRRSLWGLPGGGGFVTKDGRLIPTHHHTWDSAIRLFENSDSLNEFYQKRALNGIGYLRDMLGERWPENEEVRDHPLLDVIGNPVVWCAGLIGDFAEVFRNLEKTPGFDTLVGKFRDPLTCEEALSVAHTASLMSSSGSVEALWKTRNGRVRDLIVNIHGLHLFMEVTCVKSSVVNRQRRTEDAILLPVMARFGTKARGWVKPLSRTRTREARKRILKALDELEKTDSPQHVSMPRAFDLTLYPKPSREAEFRVEGFSPNRKEVRLLELERLRSTITEKADRYSSQTANALVIYCDHRAFSDIWYNSDFAELIVNDIEESIYDKKHLSFLALVFITIGHGEDEAQSKEYIYRAKTTHGLILERTLVISNESAEHQVPVSFTS